MTPNSDGNVDVVSTWVRPTILTGGALLFLATSLKALPEAWGMSVSDLGLQQSAILLLLFAGLINASLFLAQRSGNAGAFSGMISTLLDLVTIGCLVLSATGQRSWFVPFLLVAVAASAGTGRQWIVIVSTLLAGGLFVGLPYLQTAMGRTADVRTVADQVTLVGIILAAGAVTLGFASRSSQLVPNAGCWCEASLRVLSIVLPCVLLGTLDPWAGVAAAIPSLIVLGTIQAQAPGTARRVFTHLVAWGTGLAALAGSIATLMTGVLLVDSLIPRVMDQLSGRVPQLQQPWVGWVAIFGSIFIISELGLRAIWPTRRAVNPA